MGQMSNRISITTLFFDIGLDLGAFSELEIGGHKFNFFRKIEYWSRG